MPLHYNRSVGQMFFSYPCCKETALNILNGRHFISLIHKYGFGGGSESMLEMHSFDFTKSGNQRSNFLAATGKCHTAQSIILQLNFTFVMPTC